MRLPLADRIDFQELDWEKHGRALMEYGGVPLAVFMAIGILVNFLRGYGYYHTFLDPMQNYHLYFVVNFWIVAGVYAYRQRFQKPLLLENRKEMAVAGLAAFAWILSQPIFLLTGYGAYMVAVLRQDTLHGSFLPDLDDIEEEEDESDAEAWGHLESVKDNMTV